MTYFSLFRVQLALVQGLLSPMRVVVQVPLPRVIVIVVFVVHCLAASVFFELELDRLAGVHDTSAPGRGRLALDGVDAV